MSTLVENLDFFQNEKRFWTNRDSDIASQFWLAGIYHNLGEKQKSIRSLIRFVSDVDEFFDRLTDNEKKKIRFHSQYAIIELANYGGNLVDNPEERERVLGFIKKIESKRPPDMRHLNFVRVILGLPYIRDEEIDFLTKK